MTADSHALAVPEEHSAVAGLSHDTRGGISNPILGMLLFICSEVMFFSGLFAAYFTVRAASPIWPPIVQGGPDAASKAAAEQLTEAFKVHNEPWFAALLTIILILSSFTMVKSVQAIFNPSEATEELPPPPPVGVRIPLQPLTLIRIPIP